MPIFNYNDLTAIKYFEGQITDLNKAPFIRTGVNADTKIILFGRGVVQGTPDNKSIKLPSTVSDIFIGIAVYTETFEKRSDPQFPLLTSIDSVTGKMGYPLQRVMGYLYGGAIAVLIDGTVTVGQPAYCRFTGGEAGVFRADSDTSKAIAVPSSRFLKSGVAGDVVPLAIELP